VQNVSSGGRALRCDTCMVTPQSLGSLENRCESSDRDHRLQVVPRQDVLHHRGTDHAVVGPNGAASRTSSDAFAGAGGESAKTSRGRSMEDVSSAARRRAPRRHGGGSLTFEDVGCPCHRRCSPPDVVRRSARPSREAKDRRRDPLDDRRKARHRLLAIREVTVTRRLYRDGGSGVLHQQDALPFARHRRFLSRTASAPRPTRSSSSRVGLIVSASPRTAASSSRRPRHHQS